MSIHDKLANLKYKIENKKIYPLIRNIIFEFKMAAYKRKDIKGIPMKEVVLTKAAITVPNKIRKLYSNAGLFIFFLSTRKFKVVIRKYGFSPDTLGCVFTETGITLFDGEKLKKLDFSQKQINYFLLHELAHYVLNSGDEFIADVGALKIARINNIDCDNSLAIIE